MSSAVEVAAAGEPAAAVTAAGRLLPRFAFAFAVPLSSADDSLCSASGSSTVISSAAFSCCCVDGARASADEEAAPAAAVAVLEDRREERLAAGAAGAAAGAVIGAGGLDAAAAATAASAPLLLRALRRLMLIDGLHPSGAGCVTISRSERANPAHFSSHHQQHRCETAEREGWRAGMVLSRWWLLDF